MATHNSRSGLTPQEALLERVLREVVTRVQDTGFVLKGGGALVFVYGSPRHTTDLDFDAERKTDMTRRMRRAIQASGVEIDEGTWWWPKGTRTTRDSMRYKVEFVDNQGEREELQVDTRYRPRPESSEIVTVNGIRTYKIEALYDQKLAALSNRHVARDVFDLAFLSSKYGYDLRDDQIFKAEYITRDMNGLEVDLIHQLQYDPILARITNAENIVLEFREAIVTQIQQRKIEDVEQSIPMSIPMTEEIIALRRLIHGEETLIPKRIQLSHRIILHRFDRPDGGHSIQNPDWYGR